MTTKTEIPPLRVGDRVRLTGKDWGESPFDTTSIGAEHVVHEVEYVAWMGYTYQRVSFEGDDRFAWSIVEGWEVEIIESPATAAYDIAREEAQRTPSVLQQLAEWAGETARQMRDESREDWTERLTAYDEIRQQLAQQGVYA